MIDIRRRSRMLGRSGAVLAAVAASLAGGAVVHGAAEWPSGGIEDRASSVQMSAGEGPSADPVSRPAQTAPPAASATGPRFVREVTRIEPRGDAVLVTYEEVGLQPGSTSTIEVGVERTTSLRCTPPGAPDQVVLQTSSSASATETTQVQADEHGRLKGERLLHAAPGTVRLDGFECKTTERFTVSLRDLTSGATLSVEQ